MRHDLPLLPFWSLVPLERLVSPQKTPLERVTIVLANIMRPLASKHSAIALWGVLQNWANRRVEARVTFIKWQGTQLAANTDASLAQHTGVNKRLQPWLFYKADIFQLGKTSDWSEGIIVCCTRRCVMIKSCQKDFAAAANVAALWDPPHGFQTPVMAGLI